MRSRTFSSLSLFLLSGLPILAELVTVTPEVSAFVAGEDPDRPVGGRGLAEHQRRFQFRVVQENGDPDPGPWGWSILAEDGTTVRADAGRITPRGVYYPPEVSFAKEGKVWIRATDQRDPDRSGQALVMLRVGREAALDWNLPRVHCLAGDDSCQPWSLDPERRGPEGVAGARADFDWISSVCHASVIPMSGDTLEDQWLVADWRRVSAIDREGRVRTLGVCTEKAKPEWMGAQGQSQYPSFFTLACNVGAGIDPDSWRCVLEDVPNDCLWEIDDKGTFSRIPQSGGCGDFCVDRDGTVYAVPTSPAPPNRPGLPGRPGGHLILRRHTRAADWSTLDCWAAASDLGRIEVGHGEVPALKRVRSLVLDPVERILYVLGENGYTSWSIYAVQVATGRTTFLSVRGGPEDFFEDPGAFQWRMAHGKGRLLVSRTEVSRTAVGRLYQGFTRIAAIDPETGQCTEIYRDSEAACLMQPGPCLGSMPAPPRQGWANLGFCHSLALAPDGRIAFPSAREVGLLLLDWKDPNVRVVTFGAVIPEDKGKPRIKERPILGFLKSLCTRSK
jgi:hypothetical protein